MKPYYDEEGITIYHADCREVLPTLSGVIVTDPPYGNLTPYESYQDTPDALASLINEVYPVMRGVADVVALTPGIGNLHKWPASTWTLCWYSGNGKGSSSWGFNTWQPILVYGPDPYLAAGLGRRPDGFNIHLGPYNLTTERTHPTPKPVQVMRWILQRVSVPDDGRTFIDPFMGSGTTLRAAKDLGRKAIGIEIEERYCEIAVKRLAQGVLQF